MALALRRWLAGHVTVELCNLREEGKRDRDREGETFFWGAFLFFLKRPQERENKFKEIKSPFVVLLQKNKKWEEERKSESFFM